MNSDKQKSYFRTLIFTVFAFIVSIGLLVLLWFKRDLMVFISLIEVFIFIIIGYCITNIVEFEKTLQEMRSAANYTLKLDSCPDYYIKRRDAEQNLDFCSNEYVVVDKNSPVGKKLIMKILPELADVNSNPTFPVQHSTDFLNDPYNKTGLPRPIDKFYLSTLDQFATTKDKCDVISPYTTVGDKAGLQDLKQVPWTYARSRCNGLYVNYDSNKVDKPSLM